MDHYDLSVFLSKIIGVAFVVYAMAILTNLSLYTAIARKLSENPLLLFIVGTIDFVLGLLIINVHNDWVSNWTVLVTVAGWILAVRGCVRLVFPRFVIKTAKQLSGKVKWLLAGSAVGLLVYGGFLLYFGLGVHLL